MDSEANSRPASGPAQAACGQHPHPGPQPHTVCGCCQRSMAKARALWEGIPYCSACYKREFRPLPCEGGCGRTVRTLQGQTPALCKTCRNRGRSCLRCGKPVPQAALTLEEGVACPSCARYFKAPQPCPACGQYSLRLARDFKAGFHEPVCQHCRTRGHITCAGCGKHRKPAGVDDQNRPLCKPCLERPGPFICPQCHQAGQPHSQARCVDCYWRDKARHAARQVAGQLRQNWLRPLWMDFAEHLIKDIGPQPTALRLERYALFFAKLDGALTGPDQIETQRMVELFGIEGLRRQNKPHSYLIRRGLLPPDRGQARQEQGEQDKQQRILHQAQGQWFESLLVDYEQHLQALRQRYIRRGWTGDNTRLSASSLTSYLRAALRLLQSLPAPVEEARLIQQEHLDSFSHRYPGYVCSAGRFVRFLNRAVKRFRALKIYHPERSVPQGIFLGQDRYRQLVRQWLMLEDDASESQLKESLLCLFQLLYAQPIKRLVRLRLSNLLQDKAGDYHIRFAQVDLTLAPPVSQLLDRYLKLRRARTRQQEDWGNDYLFDGRTRGEHLSQGAVTFYLRKHDLSNEQLFATALYQAYLNGIKSPKMLMKAYGITASTAVKYLNLIDPRLVDEVHARPVQA